MIRAFFRRYIGIFPGDMILRFSNCAEMRVSQHGLGLEKLPKKSDGAGVAAHDACCHAGAGFGQKGSGSDFLQASEPEKDLPGDFVYHD